MKKNAPANNKNGQIYIDFKIAVAVLVTFALLFCCLVVMFVGLAIDSSDSGSGYVSGGDGGGGKNNNSSVNVSANPTVSNKTGIVLPCATKEGTYLSASDGETKDISGDTNIKSAAAVLIDVTDNKTVAGKNADTRVYPASMTKVMTLLIACENAKDPTALLTLTADKIDKYNKTQGNDKEGPSLAFTWEEGYQVTVEDALYMVIYRSDTYACWLLADHIAGSEEKFVELMNSRAKALGLTATNYTNCTGLYDQNHYTTCREMAAVMAAAMNNETAKAVLMSISQYSVDIYINGEASKTAGMWSNWYTGRLENNKLSGVAPYYPGGGSDVKLIAGKTGYETIPKCCFVTAGCDDKTNRVYVCVQVGRTDATQPTVDEAQSTNDTRYIYRTYAKEKSDD